MSVIGLQRCAPVSRWQKQRMTTSCEAQHMLTIGLLKHLNVRDGNVTANLGA